MTDYKFGVYDLLVLPPSFPYGGMVSCSSHSKIVADEFRGFCYTGKCMSDVPNSK